MRVLITFVLRGCRLTYKSLMLNEANGASKTISITSAITDVSMLLFGGDNITPMDKSSSDHFIDLCGVMDHAIPVFASPVRNFNPSTA